MTDPVSDDPASGRVVLVGGGPGADDLITVRGLDRLRAADVVIVDRLAPRGLLDRLDAHVEVIDASRGPDSRTLTHDEIVALMISHARAGRNVVRLKGGDPLVLAHGAEEAAECARAGVDVEIVPGVTSATAGAAFAGVPLTGAGGAAGFSVVSGHLAPDDPESRIDWGALSRSGTTIVVLMGVRRLAAIAARLVAEGVSPDADAACVSDASLPTQRVVRARLADLADNVRDAGLANPAIVVIDAAASPAVHASGGPRRVLVLGGSRSGKSGHAERLAGQAADDDATVVYVATSATDPHDPEWAARVERHRRRRPAGWQTLEGRDLAALLASNPRDTLLVDSVTSWLARAMDDAGCWTEPPAPHSAKVVADEIDALTRGWAGTSATVFAVSDEVGSGIVPASESGRRFRDLLGELNQRLAATADEVWLVTAGIARRLR